MGDLTCPENPSQLSIFSRITHCLPCPAHDLWPWWFCGLGSYLTCLLLSVEDGGNNRADLMCGWEAVGLIMHVKPLAPGPGTGTGCRKYPPD